jgi:hypothetical protein
LYLHKFPIVAEIVVGAVCILSGIAVVSTLACNGDVLFVDLPSCKYENSYGKSGLVLAVKKLRLQRSNNIRYLIFVLFVRLPFCFHGSWRKAQFIFLTNAL